MFVEDSSTKSTDGVLHEVTVSALLNCQCITGWVGLAVELVD